MLSKLLKYETKATARWFLPLFTGMILFALLNKLFMLFDPVYSTESIPGWVTNIVGLFQGVIAFMYVMIIMATFVVALLLMIQRFYKNLLGDEGYLMFTLPIKPSLHIWSKLLVSVMWTILSVIVAFLSVFVLVFDSNLLKSLIQIFSKLPYLFEQIFNNIDVIHAILWFTEVIVLLLVSLFSTYLMFYAAMALGHTRNTHRVLYAFGFYLAISFIFSVIEGLIMIISGILFSDLLSLMSPVLVTHIALIGYIVITAAIGIVCFIITNHVLSKRLNLE